MFAGPRLPSLDTRSVALTSDGEAMATFARDILAAQDLEGAVDIHNNTGDNPFYAIVPDPTPVSARSYRYAFSHADHGTRDRLACTECHKLTPGAAQTRQVSSPAPGEHFVTTRGMTCLTCHNGKRTFGGDLAFKDCRRCHTGPTFKMP